MGDRPDNDPQTPMTHTVEPEQEPREQDVDPLEDSELARRLRRMEWPTAPPGAKERGLEEILAEARKLERDADGNGKPTS